MIGKGRVVWAVVGVLGVFCGAGIALGEDVAKGKGGKWIVVTGPAFREEIRPLEKRRAQEGFDVTVLQTTDLLNAEELRRNDGRKILAKVRELWKGQQEKSYVLLVGSVVAGNGGVGTGGVVPALPGVTGRMARWPTDNAYGCRRGDVMPVVAVGRMPGRTAAEVRGMVAKTLAFEEEGKAGAGGAGGTAWRRMMTLLVGSPGGESTPEKMLGDWYINTATPAMLGQVDPVWNVRTIFHVPSSPWYVTDGQLHDQSLAFLKEGQTFVMHLGHSSPDGFWSEGAKFMDRADWQSLNVPHGGAGVFVTCGCWSCQWDPQGREEKEGFGIAAMRNATGPVAVIGATEESYSVAGYLAFNGILRALSKPALPERLGDVWLDAEKGIGTGAVGYLTYQMFDYGDGSAGKIPLEVQRKEHMEMWTLLGDPAMRLPEVGPKMVIEGTKSAAAGGVVKVSGKLPSGMEGAKVRVTVERGLGVMPVGLAAVPAAQGVERDKVVMANFMKSQERLMGEVLVEGKGGAFEAEIAVPKEGAGEEVVVRAVASVGKREAMGVMRVKVEKGK